MSRHQNDQRRRVVGIYSEGQFIRVTVGTFKMASLVGSYTSAVKTFLETNDHRYLRRYVGERVTDVKGRLYTFETRPNQLYRLNDIGHESFEEIYRIIT